MVFDTYFLDINSLFMILSKMAMNNVGKKFALRHLKLESRLLIIVELKRLCFRSYFYYISRNKQIIFSFYF